MLLGEGAHERTFKMAHRLTLFSFWAGVGSRSRLCSTGPSSLHTQCNRCELYKLRQILAWIDVSITNALCALNSERICVAATPVTVELSA